RRGVRDLPLRRRFTGAADLRGRQADPRAQSDCSVAARRLGSRAGMDAKKAAGLFVDVCGSTAFFDRYGEVAGHAMVGHCFTVVVPEVEKRAGRIVKYMGDGFLAVFDDAFTAVDAAAALHSALADDNALRPDGARVRVHSGVSVGSVVMREDGDVFGDTVN